MNTETVLNIEIESYKRRYLGCEDNNMTRAIMETDLHEISKRWAKFLDWPVRFVFQISRRGSINRTTFELLEAVARMKEQPVVRPLTPMRSYVSIK